MTQLTQQVGDLQHIYAIGYAAGRLKGQKEGWLKAARKCDTQSFLVPSNRTAQWTEGYVKACEDCAFDLLYKAGNM